jgi:tetratricopeptide (TPR) repeat protein
MEPAASASYRAALDLDGSNLIALNNLASILVPDSPDEALKYARQAGEIAPDNPVVEDTLGWVYYRKQIYPLAIDYLKKAVAKSPTPRIRFHLAMSYLKAGDRELGQKTLAEALRQNPGLLETEKGW